MKKLYTKWYLPLFSLLFALSSCGSDDSDYTMTSPVVIDFNASPFPYTKLSEYKFFEGEMKNQIPAYKVIPYDLNSPLFTDYAHKKRFIWMPEGSQATYDADDKILNFPSGTALIKTFYYDNVLPANTTRIIETRVMIKKNSEWIFANYVWNDEQTEAYLDMDGSFTQISWNEGSVTKTADYRIPSGTECFTCHKSNNVAIPIGTKPQNLDKLYNYNGNNINQLSKLVTEGYLDSSVPSSIVATVDWTDASKPLQDRVRSYLDINCAHCHSENAHCDYRPLRLAFSETDEMINLGVCVLPNEPIAGQTHIVARGNAQRSVMHFRLNSVNESERMPLLGRTVTHTEGVALIKAWINSLDESCP